MAAVFRLVAWLALTFLLITTATVLLMRWVSPPFSAVMLEQPGTLGDIEHIWVDRETIAKTAAYAVIAAEDQRFTAHHGIDFTSLSEAVDDYRNGDELRGASTITQQVAKNLFLWQGRSLTRKALEGYFALLLEACWSKERILEMYLNFAEFGPNVFGVEAASQSYFGRSASALTTSQAALLAAVLPNPHRLRADDPSLYVRGRQAYIAAQMTLLEVRGHYRDLRW